MYFVRDDKKAYWENNKEHYNKDIYTVLRVENKKITDVEISKEDMPKNIKVNDVFTINDGKYIIDNSATKEIEKEIRNMAEEIIQKQNTMLNDYREEGHLYMVTEELGNNRFLKDLTNSSNFEFEEVNIPNDLLDLAIEGSVLIYTNGTYEYYSNNGFEMMNNIK